MTDVTLEPWQLRYAAVRLHDEADLSRAETGKRALEIVAQFCEHTAKMMDKRNEP